MAFSGRSYFKKKVDNNLHPPKISIISIINPFGYEEKFSELIKLVGDKRKEFNNIVNFS